MTEEVFKARKSLLLLAEKDDVSLKESEPFLSICLKRSVYLPVCSSTRGRVFVSGFVSHERTTSPFTNYSMSKEVFSFLFQNDHSDITVAVYRELMRKAFIKIWLLVDEHKEIPLKGNVFRFDSPHRKKVILITRL